MSASTPSPVGTHRARASHLGPAVRRPMVLDAALAVWVEHGADGMTMNAIAEAAGVTKPVVYECFDSKADVLRSLFEREEKRLVDAADAALPDDLDLRDLRATVEASYTAFFTAAVASPASWRLVYEGQSAVPAALAERANAARATVTRRITDLVTASTQHSDRPLEPREVRFMAEALVAFAESGARMLVGRRRRPEWTPDELAAHVTRRVFRGWAEPTA